MSAQTQTHHPLPRSVPDSLNTSIDLARQHLRDARIAQATARRSLNHLLARRAQMLDRTIRRFPGALEHALTGEGPLDQKLARGMRIANDTDPDPDDDSDNDPSDSDDTVLSAPGDDAHIDYAKEGPQAEEALREIHGGDFDNEMARAFADEVERLAAQDIEEALADARIEAQLREIEETDPPAHVRAEHDAMDAIHNGAPDDEHYLDSSGDA